MSRPNRNPRPAHHEEHPATAADEVLHEAAEAETSVVDDGERRGKDREAADALTPNEDAQDHIHKHGT